VITDRADYARLFATLDRLVAEGRMRPTVRAFLITAALTGLRRSELQTLTWAQVDLGERRITLVETKGGRLARGGSRSETLSIPPLAASALAGVMPVAGEITPAALVFPPQRGRAIEVNHCWAQVRQEAGLPAALTLHGLRHSLGTAAVLSGLSGPEVQQLLRHRSIGMSARYIHLAELTSSRLQDRATERLTAGIGDATPSAEIHTLPPRRRA
jgi:integrase